MRWEAVKDSVWTFDTGVGSFLKEPGHTYPGVDPFKPDGLHGGMEGWTGKDNTYSELTFFRRLGAGDPRWLGFPCVGSAKGLGGAYSFWAGALPAEADSLCFVSGRGYGNNWNVCIERAFPYGGGAAQLSYQFHNETEDSFDYTYVYCDTSSAGNRVEIAAYTGNVSGTAQFNLTPGIELPVIAKPIKLQFCVSSDPGWSDQDGLEPTSCGAFAVDNVNLTGAITYTCDFEADEGGWLLSPPSPGPGGEWSDLAYLEDLPLPDSLAASCAIRDSVLVFFDSTGAHPPLQNNVAISPWIDLERFGIDDRTGFAIKLGGYFDLPLLNYVFVKSEAQWFPDSCRVSGKVGVSPWITNDFFFNFGSGESVCNRTYNISFEGVIPPEVDEVRVAVGVLNYCRFFENCTEVTNTSPWLDNVRFAAYKITYSSLQIAIDNAAPGDTVWVSPGTYHGPGDVDLTFRGKNVVLKSVAGAVATIIDGSHSYRGFVSNQGEDSTAAVIGFTFRNCKATDQGSLSDVGGAVHVGSGSSIRFEDCVFLTSTASYGGAVHVAFEGEPTFRRCTFLQNTAIWGGGGIAAFGGAFDSCWILENHAGSGGGVFVYNGQLSRCTIQANTASFGGGIYGYYSDFARFGRVEVQDCLITGNKAALRGGGLDLHNSMRMSGTTVTGNFAELAGGMYALGRVSAHRSIFWGNGADSSGAEVFLGSGPATFTCSAVDSSQMGGPGQAVFEGPQVFGDPLFCLPEFASSAPTTEGDYTLAINSPCLPFASPCDSLIGALGEGCGFVSVVPPPVPEEPLFLKTPGIHTGPNPFTQDLAIHYLSPFGTDPQLEIYSVDGRLVGTWSLRPGSGVVRWDGRDPVGKPVASGIYLVRYMAGDLQVVRRVVRITQ